MEQKRVSFKVAKAIKEAGYPQNYSFNVSVYDKDEKEVAIGVADIPLNCDAILAPTYLDVRLWLWREKGIEITHRIGVNITGIEDNDAVDGVFNDPEEAIIAAIEYLVDNDLIK